jgi:hypothetical protein
MPDPGYDVRPVLLDEHPAAAAIAALPPDQVGADVVLAEGQAGGYTFNYDDQSLSMGLACC